MGARSVITKRLGPVTDIEKDMVAKFVLDQPAAITPSQTNALARVLRRSKDVTKRLIEEAKDKLVDSTERYVDIHRQTVETALSNGDAKSLEVALKGSQWAMEHISQDGTRVVDKAGSGGGNSGTKVLIGVQIGGLREPLAIDVPVTVEAG